MAAEYTDVIIIMGRVGDPLLQLVYPQWPAALFNLEVQRPRLILKQLLRRLWHRT